MSLWWLFLLCPVSYIIGNINFSVIISRNIIKKDVREQGSGNPGATNMLRNFGFKWGLIILICDVIKGVLPTLLGALLYGYGSPQDTRGYGPVVGSYGGNATIALYACGLAAVFGHCVPCFYQFRGGKGLATMVGVFLVANPALSAASFAIGVGVLLLLEYGSLSSFIVLTADVVWEIMRDRSGIAVTCMLFAFYALIVFTHRKNIVRLLTERENRASVFKRKKKINPEVPIPKQ